MAEDGDTQAWRATVKRLMLYMLFVPVLAGLMIARDVQPWLILAVTAGALLLFIFYILWTFAKLQDD